MSLPHAWPVDQVVTEATRGRAAVLEHVHRRPRHTWHSARSRGHAQSTLRAESSPSRALLACGHSKMVKAAEVLQRDLGTGKSFCSSVLNSARPPMCSVQKTTETGSAATPSDANRAKPMVLKNRHIFSRIASSRAATRHCLSALTPREAHGEAEGTVHTGYICMITCYCIVKITYGTRCYIYIGRDRLLRCMNAGSDAEGNSRAAWH
jgi:hypothetical protein